MKRKLIALITIFAPLFSHAYFDNYNSILVGEMAAGMGGAATALIGDPAGASYYNPAILSRLEGTSISALANLYNKFDTSFGEKKGFFSASSRLNRGGLRSIPASSGSVIGFGSFAIGLSVLIPDFDWFSGEIKNTSDTKTYVSFFDESLWVGANLAMNLSKKNSVGFTFYYTSRTFQRTHIDELIISGTDTVSSNEQRTFTTNSILYLLGYHHYLSPTWSLGVMVRPPSVPLSGRGTYFKSTIDTRTTPETPTAISGDNIHANTKTPLKASLGLSYRQLKKLTLSFDFSYYGKATYTDLEVANEGIEVHHDDTFNFAAGIEYYMREWMHLRFGLFTNFSAHPEVPANPTELREDHVDMWGFSANAALFTSEKVSFTVGGYYTGGNGQAVEQIGQQIQVVDKSVNIFSFLVGSSYFF